MQYFVYIGKDSKTINLFSKLSIGVFYAASNCNQAIKVLDKIREKIRYSSVFRTDKSIPRYCKYSLYAQKVSGTLYGTRH